MTDFNVKSIMDEPICEVKIEAYKNTYIVSGIIGGKYKISASNAGEYRYSLSYDSTSTFTLRSFDYVSLSVYSTELLNEFGEPKLIYRKN